MNNKPKSAIGSMTIQGGVGQLGLAVYLYFQGSHQESAVALLTALMTIVGRIKAQDKISQILPRIFG